VNSLTEAVGVLTGMETGHILNTSQKCYCMMQLAYYREELAIVNSYVIFTF
jgi:hypothetical protein